MSFKRVACGLISVLSILAGPAGLMAQKASDIRIKHLEFDEKGYRWVKEDRAWKEGVPTVLVKLESKTDIEGISSAKVYYFDADKKQIGVSPAVNSDFIHTKAGRDTGFGNPKKLLKNVEMELHFAPPPNLKSEDVARILLVIGTNQFVAVKMEPNATVEDFDFAEKALYQASQ